MTNVGFWKQKLSETVMRDERNATGLREMGWKVLVVWECELANPDRLAALVSAIRTYER